MRTEDIERLIYTPAQASEMLIKRAEHNRDVPGIKLGVQVVDSYITPIRPPALVGVVARPGMGKTSLLALIARNQARSIVMQNSNEIVLSFTWEQAIEELEAFFHLQSGVTNTDVAKGIADIDALRSSAAEREKLPIWLVGHSMFRDGKTPQMTVPVMYQTVELIEDKYKVKVKLVTADYLQVMPVTGARGKKEAVPQIPNLLRSFTLRKKVACVVGIQAARSVDNRNIKLPNDDECEWSSATEQAVDYLMGLWRPCKTELPGKTIALNGESYEVTENLGFVRVNKQRNGPPGRIFAMYWTPHLLKLAELDAEPEHRPLIF